MSSLSILIFALLLDALLGEPKWLWSRIPHPAVLMGHAVRFLETRLNKGAQKKRNGVILLVLLCIGAGTIGSILAQISDLITLVITAILLAQKSLLQHVARVAQGLRMSVQQGRADVAMIVGRNTEQMDETAITRAAIESGAENFSDGVIAPAFWFVIAGLPGILIYKAVNTADSMIGYKTDAYRDFGWAAARFDDLLNLLPARLSALLIALPAGVLGHWRSIATDAAQHRSPNAGWPEAAMARALNIALSGPRVYARVQQDFPLVHGQGRLKSDARDIDAATGVLWKAWGCGVGLLVLLNFI